MDQYLGFDFGLRRIGVAVGQALTGTASPLLTLDAVNGQPDWSRVLALVEEWHPAALVVGIPLHMDGTEQPMTGAARRFARRLRERTRLPVHEADERLSSRLAEEQIRAGRRAGRRGRTRAGEVDRMAAGMILENWMRTRHD